MAQFVQTHSEGKALLYEGYKYQKIHDGKKCTVWRCKRHKSQNPARVHGYILTFIGKEESTFHICHNLEWRCTCSFIHVFMLRLTVDLWEVDLMGVDPVGSRALELKCQSWNDSGIWHFEE